MGGSGESVDAENEDGGKWGRRERGEERDGKQGELSSLHGHRLWAFFTAGEQMK